MLASGALFAAFTEDTTDECRLARDDAVEEENDERRFFVDISCAQILGENRFFIYNEQNGSSFCCCWRRMQSRETVKVGKRIICFIVVIVRG